MDKMKIREVIVVEGKDDTKRINMAVNADTLETRGSAISDETLEQIEESCLPIRIFQAKKSEKLFKKQFRE